MNINIVKVLEKVGYANAKTMATKIFGGYTVDINKAKVLILEQSKKTGKFAGEYAKFVDADLSEYDVDTVGVATKAEEKEKPLSARDKKLLTKVKELMKDIADEDIDNVFETIEYTDIIGEYLSETTDQSDDNDTEDEQIEPF